MPWIDSHLQLLTSLPHTTLSRTLKVRGGIISQANRYLGGFCSSQRIFPPQIIQVLLIMSLCVPPSGESYQALQPGMAYRTGESSVAGEAHARQLAHTQAYVVNLGHNTDKQAWQENPSLQRIEK